jgi:adenylosuccinate synthase
MGSRAAFIVVDLGFGDAGKGTIVDYLVRSQGAQLVVRYNGGAQAGHNVVTDDGRHHTFSQLGSGTFVPGVRTHLAATTVLHPTALLVEERHLRRAGVTDALERLTIAREALVTTPFHQAAGRLRELARRVRHGSCGVGVGETVLDSLWHPNEVIRARDLCSPKLVRMLERVRWRLLETVRQWDVEARAEIDILEDRQVIERWMEGIAPLLQSATIIDDAAVSLEGTVIFEGAQGVLLDEHCGFHPHTTWSNCTTSHARSFLWDRQFTGTIHRVGVVRPYLTRHGEGPLPSEIAELDCLPEPHNTSDGWQGRFRRGWADPMLWRYALEATGGVDSLAVTHLDQLALIERWRVVSRYAEQEGLIEARGLALGQRNDLDHRARLTQALFGARLKLDELDPNRFPRWIESELGVPVWLTSFGPTAGDKRERQ